MRAILIAAIRLYKKYLSPMLPPACRFEPTCSEYALTALSRFGVCRGGLLAMWRILRCNPLCRGGYDPVPPKKQSRQKNRPGSREEPKEIVTYNG